MIFSTLATVLKPKKPLVSFFKIIIKAYFSWFPIFLILAAKKLAICALINTFYLKHYISHGIFMQQYYSLILGTLNHFFQLHALYTYTSLVVVVSEVVGFRHTMPFLLYAVLLPSCFWLTIHNFSKGSRYVMPIPNHGSKFQRNITINVSLER